MDLRWWLLRHVLSRVWRVSRGLLMGVRGVVLDNEGRVLLVRHTYIGGWHLPGGGVGIGESAAAALARELGEEAGVRLTAPAVLHGLFHHPQFWRGDHVAVYVVRRFAQDNPPRRSYEIAETGFFAMDELPAATSGGTRRRLAEVLDGTARASGGEATAPSFETLAGQAPQDEGGWPRTPHAEEAAKQPSRSMC